MANIRILCAKLQKKNKNTITLLQKETMKLAKLFIRYYLDEVHKYFMSLYDKNCDTRTKN